jgi:hypothetical protein
MYCSSFLAMDVVFNRLQKDVFCNLSGTVGEFSDVIIALPIFNKAEVVKQ